MGNGRWEMGAGRQKTRGKQQASAYRGCLLQALGLGRNFNKHLSINHGNQRQLRAEIGVWKGPREWTCVVRKFAIAINVTRTPKLPAPDSHLPAPSCQLLKPNEALNLTAQLCACQALIKFTVLLVQQLGVKYGTPAFPLSFRVVSGRGRRAGGLAGWVLGWALSEIRLRCLSLSAVWLTRRGEASVLRRIPSAGARLARLLP